MVNLLFQQNYNTMKEHLKLAMVLLFILVSARASSQGITVYQYRHVPQEQMSEFIERETKYWSVVAQKAIDNGKLEFWALLVKEGIYDAPNTSNVLFINTFKDIDDTDGIWDANAVFPNVPIEDISTYNMGYVTSVFYVKDENWEQASHADPEKDFNYVVMVYHNSTNPTQFIALEKEHWAPFIKSAMDNKKTTQVGWGNGRILSPSGENIKVNSVSYDIYPSLKEVLMPTWDESIEFPVDGLAKLDSLTLNRRGNQVYRIVKAVNNSGNN